MDMQERDKLCMFLEGRGYPSEFDKDQKRRLREIAASFFYKLENSDDCGLFASAFPLDWALGHPIEDITYKVPRMCQHLIECLEVGCI